MHYNSTSLNICEVCHLPRGKGGHAKCSKIKQQLASKVKRKSSTAKTYENSRLLTGFLKTIES